MPTISGKLCVYIYSPSCFLQFFPPATSQILFESFEIEINVLLLEKFNKTLHLSKAAEH